MTVLNQIFAHLMPTAIILLVTIHVPVTLVIQEMAKNAKVREMDDYIFVVDLTLSHSIPAMQYVGIFICF